MKKLILIFVIISGSICCTYAQNESHEDRRQKYQAEKVAFLTDKLELTPSEAQKFWPLYNEMEDKKWEIQRMRHELESKVRDEGESLSDREVVKLTRDFTENLQKESRLYAEYNEKFLNVLPPKKVLSLYNAENEFRMHMIKKFRDRRRNDESNQ